MGWGSPSSLWGELDTIDCMTAPVAIGCMTYFAVLNDASW